MHVSKDQASIGIGWRFLVAVSLLLSLAAAVPVRAGSITGTVTGAGGEPLEGAWVCAFDLSWDWAGCEPTDASGDYAIGGLYTGGYKLVFDGQGIGYFDEWYQDKPDFEGADAISVTAGSTTSGIDASLAIPGSITGKVTGSGGVPIAGVWVCAYDLCRDAAGCVNTDAAGVYTIGWLPAGSYKMEFDARWTGYFNEWYRDKPDFDAAKAVIVTAGARTTGINASLALGGSITGRVTGQGRALKGVWVCAHDLDNQWGMCSYTDAYGAYTIGGLPTGGYKVEFEAEGSGYLNEWYRGKPDFDAAIAVAVTAGSRTAKINASLVPGGSITGTVTGSGGDPLDNVWVCAVDLYNDWAGCESTDTAGVYTIGGLPAGSYKVEFDSQGSDYRNEWFRNKQDFAAAAAVAVAAGSTTAGIDASLARGGSITGMVTDPRGELLEGVWVCAQGLDANTADCEPTDATGVYTIGGLATGSYWVRFEGGGSGYLDEWYPGKFDFDAAAAVAVTAKSTTAGINASLALPGSITGMVTGSGGNPLEGVRVCVYDPSGGEIWCENTDASGVYTIGGLPTGAYKVEFDGVRSGYFAEWHQDKLSFDDADAVAVVAGLSTSGIDAFLALGGSIAGTVTGAAGNQLGRVWVCAYDPDQNESGCGETNAFGAYTIVGLPTGSYTVKFHALGSYLNEWYQDKQDFSAADAVVVTAGLTTEGIDVSLAPGGGISGRVRPGVSTAGEVEVRVFSKTGNSWVERGWGYPTCDGTYTVGGLPAGSYYVQFDPGRSGYQMEFYGNASTIDDASLVAVSTGQVTLGIDADLDLDTTAPQNGKVKVTPGDSRLTLNWSGFTDAGSGIIGYRAVFREGDAPASCNSGTAVKGYDGSSTTLVHTGLVNGTTYGYRICAIDAAGNRSSGAARTGRPVPETNPPTGTVLIRKDGETDWTKSRTVILDLTARDDSRPIKMCISNSLDCTAWTSFAKTRSWTLRKGNGTKTVNAWFRDAWGNTSAAPASDTIALDTTAPVNGTVRMTPGDSKVTLHWSEFADFYSGITGYRAVFQKGGVPSTCSDGKLVPDYDDVATTLVHAGLVNGTTYGYRICAIDAAGNMSSGATKTGKPSP